MMSSNLTEAEQQSGFSGDLLLTKQRDVTTQISYIVLIPRPQISMSVSENSDLKNIGILEKKKSQHQTSLLDIMFFTL